MKMTLRLISPYTLFDLQSDLLTFTQIKLRKILFRVYDYNKNILLIHFKNIPTDNKYYDGVNIIPYTFSIPCTDIPNTLITFQDNKEVFNISETLNLKYLEIVLKDQTGSYDNNVNNENPYIIELEFI